MTPGIEASRGVDKRAALDRLPDNGHPILIGHHSERGHRRAIERADGAMRRAIDAREVVAEADRRADVVARATGARNNPVTVANRIDRLEADLRRAQRDGRTERAADLADQVTYRTGVREAQIKDGTVTVYGSESVHKGDAVKIRGHWYAVGRANRKTVTVPSGIGSWTVTTPWQEITDHRTAEQITQPASA